MHIMEAIVDLDKVAVMGHVFINLDLSSKVVW